MKTVIAQAGTIENSGGIQADIFSISDFSLIDPGSALVAPGIGSGDLASTLPFRASNVTSSATRPATAITAPDTGTTTTLATPAVITPIDTATDISVPDIGASEADVSGAIITTEASLAGTIAYAPLVITPVFGNCILSLIGQGADHTTAQDVEGAIDAAINYYETNFTSDVPVGTVINQATISTVTVSINFGYGTIGTTPMTAGSGLARSDFSLTSIGDFSAVTSKLSATLPDLPTADPTGGGSFWVTPAQADLLGLGNSGSTVAGTIGLNSISNLASLGVSLDFDFVPGSTAAPAGEIGAVAALEHEISEVGRNGFAEGAGSEAEWIDERILSDGGQGSPVGTSTRGHHHVTTMCADDRGYEPGRIG